MSRPVPSRTIHDALNAAILAGELTAGEKLSEPAIAAEFGVSRAPVREAIRRLQERGLVTHVANHGVRVIAPTLPQFLHLLDVREALEGMAARLAASEMTKHELAELTDLVDEHGGALRAAPQGPYKQHDRDNDFHVRIARASRNPVLADLLCDQFYPRLFLCRQKHGAVKGRGLEAWKEHVRILNALQERDGEVAELQMRRHVRSARAALIAAHAD